MIFLQEIGNDSAELRFKLQDCTLVINKSGTNTYRSVGIVFRNSLKLVGSVKRNEDGNLIGVCLKHGDLEFLAISAYMPPNLDHVGVLQGIADSGCELSSLEKTKLLAQNSYETLSEWCGLVKYFIVGGDLNETRNRQDRCQGKLGFEIKEIVFRWLFPTRCESN